MHATLKSGPRRLIALDLVRSLAFIGMVIMHLAPRFNGSQPLPATVELWSGRSATLFVFASGVSLILMSRSAPTRAAARTRIIVRAVLLGILGLGLTALGTIVAIILQQFTVLFIVGACVLYWSRRALGWLWAGLVVLGPGLSFLLRGPLGYEPGRWDVLFGGYYPAITWLSYLVLGMIVGKTLVRPSFAGTRNHRVLTLGASALLAAGLFALVNTQIRAAMAQDSPTFWQQYYGSYGQTHTDSWHWLFVASPHSGSYLEVLGNTAWAIGVLGILMWLEQLITASSARISAVLLRVAVLLIAPVGQMILTAYTLHIVVIWVLMLRDAQRVWAGDWLLVWLVMIPIVIFCIVWKVFFKRGPLEQFMSAGALSVSSPKSG